MLSIAPWKEMQNQGKRAAYLGFIIWILQYSLNYLKHWSNTTSTSNLNAN